MEYLGGDPCLAQCVNECAMDDMYGCEEGLPIIAAGLNARNTVVR